MIKIDLSEVTGCAVTTYNKAKLFMIFLMLSIVDYIQPTKFFESIIYHIITTSQYHLCLPTVLCNK